MKLQKSFYNRNTIEVAKDLLGKILVHETDGKILSGIIIEDEAYIGEIDKACHCYDGKITKRTEVMFGPPGISYVYLIYGMYNCMNVVTEKEGKGSAVLIRGLKPLDGIDQMCLNRYSKSKNELTKKQIQNLTDGPGKLCRALNITKNENKFDLTKDKLYIIDNNYSNFTIKETKRINIDYAEEAKDFLWRFILEENLLR